MAYCRRRRDMRKLLNRAVVRRPNGNYVVDLVAEEKPWGDELEALIERLEANGQDTFYYGPLLVKVHRLK